MQRRRVRGGNVVCCKLFVVLKVMLAAEQKTGVFVIGAGYGDIRLFLPPNVATFAKKRISNVAYDR